MVIKHKLYPYPVLRSDSDDYVNSSFTFNVTVSKELREIELSFFFELNNDELLTMIKQGQAEFLVHIECSQTSYRNIIKSADKNCSTRILEKHLNGKVTICAFIVAIQTIPTYKNSDFNSDYANITFSLDKGSIIAIAGQYDLNVVKDVEELARVPSIFTICKYAADSEESMKIELDRDKITVALSAQSFQDYKLLTNMPRLLPVFHAMVIVPALIYAFERMRNDGIEEYQDRRWFMAMKKTLAKHEIPLNEKTLEDVPSYELAQKLLDLPIDRALNAITSFDDSEDE